MPKVTAIITTFNRAEYCREALRSILAQTYTDFEVLVLDNSSSDNTEKVVSEFDDKRIRYINHKPMNISQARNLGWREAYGQYVAFCDDDDRWLPNKLQVEVELFEKSDKNVALVYGGFIKINKEGKKTGEHHSTLQGMILTELLQMNDDFTGSASNPMIKKSVIAELGGYNDAVTTGEDFEFYLRLAKKYPIACSPVPVLEIRQHPGPRLGDRLKEAAGLDLLLLEQYQDVFAAHPKTKSFYLQRIGGKFIRSGDKKEGRKYLVRAIKANPLNLVAMAQYVLSFFSEETYRKAHAIQQRYFKRLTNKLLS